MQARRTRRLILAAGVLAGLTLMVWTARPYVSGAALVMDLAGDLPGPAATVRRWLPVSLATVTTRDIVVPTRHGAIPARVYQPDGPASRTVMVIPGLHTGGLDEPRLSRLTSRLAQSGLTVISLPLPDLRQFLVTPRSTDMIEDAGVWASEQPLLAPDGHISLVGVSFGGGLVVVAAGRPALAGRLGHVVSVGGYGDLPRVIRYLSTGLLPDGTEQPAHDYGAVIVLLGALSHLVPAEQVAPLDDAIRTFLDGSVAAGTGRPEAEQLFAEAERLESDLPEPARTIMAEVNARDVTALGMRLLPLADRVGGDPALSAERSPATKAPVFLLHGAHDTVIPQSETPALAAYLTSAGNKRVTWLLTPAISHADPNASIGVSDVWKLVRFWTQMLAS